MEGFALFLNVSYYTMGAVVTSIIFRRTISEIWRKVETWNREETFHGRVARSISPSRAAARPSLHITPPPLSPSLLLRWEFSHRHLPLSHPHLKADRRALLSVPFPHLHVPPRQRQYREANKGLYVVARNFFLLLLNCSAWPCLGPA